MRTVDLDEWMAKRPEHVKMERKVSGGRPADERSLSDSIAFIRARDRYLQERGILVRVRPREWFLDIGRS